MCETPTLSQKTFTWQKPLWTGPVSLVSSKVSICTCKGRPWNIINGLISLKKQVNWVQKPGSKGAMELSWFERIENQICRAVKIWEIPSNGCQHAKKILVNKLSNTWQITSAKLEMKKLLWCITIYCQRTSYKELVLPILVSNLECIFYFPAGILIWYCPFFAHTCIIIII